MLLTFLHKAITQLLSTKDKTPFNFYLLSRDKCFGIVDLMPLMLNASSLVMSEEVNVSMTDRGREACVASSGKYCDPLYDQKNTLAAIKRSKTNN